MNVNDIGYLPSISLIAAQAIAATANGTGVDIKDYVGTMQLLLDAGTATGTTPTLDVKIQDSDDNSTFADVTGKAFTQVTTVASRQQMVIDTNAVRRYIRAVSTLTGTTPVYPVSLQGVGVKQVFP